MDCIPALVIDNGGYTTKAGFAGDDFPDTIIPTIVGRRRHDVTDDTIRRSYVGDEAISKRDVLHLRYPFETVWSHDWENKEEIWDHVFYNELGVAPEEHPVLLTSSPLSGPTLHAGLGMRMFETYNVPQVSIADQAVMSLYASGRTTGLVVNSGEFETHITPIYCGSAMHHGVIQFDRIAGREIDYQFTKRLQERGYTFDGSLERSVMRDIKKKLCYVSLDFESEMGVEGSSSVNEKTYKLPDGQVITIGNERFIGPECLFRPSIIGYDSDRSIHQAICESIAKSDKDLRGELYGNIVLSGGSTKFPGFVERLQKELTTATSGTVKINVVAPPEREYSAWIGGSILASNTSNRGVWCSRQDYEEWGSYLFRRHFF
ncbi:actin family [Mortierella sp. GBAus27b]|nr:actin family [Mortierella sp. GBAus27b]